MDQYVLAFSRGNAIRLSPNKLFHAETFAFISAVLARPPGEHIYIKWNNRGDLLEGVSQ